IDSEIVTTSWDIIEGNEKPGKNVIIADWKADMPGVGTALYVSNQENCQVELITASYQVGTTIQEYVRDTILTQLYLKEVKLNAHYRLHKVEKSTVVFENIYTGQLLEKENVDTLVLATGHKQENKLYNELKSASIKNLHLI